MPVQPPVVDKNIFPRVSNECNNPLGAWNVTLRGDAEISIFFRTRSVPRSPSFACVREILSESDRTRVRINFFDNLLEQPSFFLFVPSLPRTRTSTCSWDYVAVHQLLLLPHMVRTSKTDHWEMGQSPVKASIVGILFRAGLAQ